MTLSEKDNQRLYGYAEQSRSKRTYTDEAMRKALKDAHTEHGSALTRERYQDYYTANQGAPHPYTIIRRHGKWSDALKDAGIPTHTRTRYSNRVTKDECLAALQAARDILGHLPSVAEYTELWKNGKDDKASLKSLGHPAEGTIRLRFDRWKLALHELEKM